jgi:sortase (surface protein transpeptidase)
MIGRAPSGNHRSSTRWVITGLLLAAAAVCLTSGLRDELHGLAGPASGPQLLPSSSWRGIGTAIPAGPVIGFSIAKTVTRAQVKPASAVPLAPPVVPRSLPLALNIPAIGVSVPVSELGLNPDNSVEVPSNSQDVGWYDLGPSPGQTGSAVILGHVDTYQGPGVFFDVRSLTPGDDLSVTLVNGAVAHFAVTSVVMYSKDDFPDQEVYGPHGGSDLQLVTCGGEFDHQTGHYLSNVVAYTSLTSMTDPPA